MWDTSKKNRGYFVQRNTELKKKIQEKTQAILDEIERKEKELKKSPEMISLSSS